jgi:hypothetical protein
VPVLSQDQDLQQYKHLCASNVCIVVNPGRDLRQAHKCLYVVNPSRGLRQAHKCLYCLQQYKHLCACLKPRPGITTIQTFVCLS